MRIILPDTIYDQLVNALQKAGKREIGGIVMGEHIGRNTFRIQAITIQFHESTNFSFKRVIQAAIFPLRQFFMRTGHNYTRFNYLGEWHSHPSFSLEPSDTDSKTMTDIVSDPSVGAHFAILLIVQLIGQNKISATANVYVADQERFQAELIQGIN